MFLNLENYDNEKDGAQLPGGYNNNNPYCTNQFIKHKIKIVSILVQSQGKKSRLYFAYYNINCFVLKF